MSSPEGESSSLRLKGLSDESIESLLARGAEGSFAVWTAPESDPQDLVHDCHFDDSSHPPLLGTYRRTQGDLHFEPRFPWAPGQRYLACFDQSRAAADCGDCSRSRSQLALSWRQAEPAGSSTPRVVDVWPHAEELPANLLRLYVEFSEPMETRDSHLAVQLESRGGAKVQNAFVEVEQGLWNSEHTRLTLFLHPGRIKRGVGPNRTLGPPLDPSRDYRLRIAGLRSKSGAIVEPHVKEFSTLDDDRTGPEPARWAVEAPIHDRAPLSVRFDEPLDAMVSQRLLRIEYDGYPVLGDVELADDDRLWIFRPQSPWSTGEYLLHVPDVVEDLAGNTPTRLFDRPTAGVASASVFEAAPTTIRLPFFVHG